MSKYTVLVARLRQELAKIETATRTAISQANKAENTGDLDYLQAAALSLQNFYMGVEQAFEQIAKQVDESLPTGASSHQELLEQMALDIPNIRPAVITSSTLRQLNQYRGFRHIVIHRYGFELQPERVRTLVEELSQCYEELSHDMESFCQFLMEIDTRIPE
ncbi:ribonuclease toxin HepT-like protein [Trichothermofontia sp.]